MTVDSRGARLKPIFEVFCTNSGRTWFGQYCRQLVPQCVLYSFFDGYVIYTWRSLLLQIENMSIGAQLVPLLSSPFMLQAITVLTLVLLVHASPTL